MTSTTRAQWRERLAHARFLWRSLTGEDAYEKYLARHRREHPDHAPMSAREFWRARADDAEVIPRCC